MRMIRGFYNEQNNTVNMIQYDTNYVISLDCGKWERGLRTSPNSQGKMDALAIDDSIEYVRLMLSGEMRIPVAGSTFHQMPVGADVFEVKRRNACPVCVWGLPQTNKGTLL